MHIIALPMPHTLLLFLAVVPLALACGDRIPWPSAVCNNDTNSWDVAGDVLVADTLNVGSSSLSVSGSLTVLPTATILVDIDGGNFGRVIAAARAALSGSLNITYRSRPLAGVTAQVVTSPTLINEFQVLNMLLAYPGADCDSVSVAQSTATDEAASSLAISSTVAPLPACAGDHVDKASIAASSVFAGLFVLGAVGVWAGAVATRT